MAVKSYFNYKIQEFSVDIGEPTFLDLTQTISELTYSESITSPLTYVSILVTNTGGILSKANLRGGEKVRLIISQDATKLKLNLTEENQNTYYIGNIRNATSESTREVFIIELVPLEFFTNETARVFRRYDNTLDDTVTRILQKELSTTRYKDSNIEKTSNKYSFMGNARKPFTVLGWMCPKGIPLLGKSGNETGTAGYLFFENQEGYNFKSADSLFNSERSPKASYFLRENSSGPADQRVNFKLTGPPIFKKSSNVVDNLKIGMYASVNYFFDTNTRKFYKNVYKLKDSYEIMNHSSNRDDAPSIPEGLEDSPSRLMVSMLDSGQMDKSGKLQAADKRMEYQAQSVTRYNLLFSQALNITVPLNLNLTVGDVIIVNFGSNRDKAGLKDKNKTGKYIISKLKHDFSDVKGLTGLELVRDSYGVPK